MKLVFATNNKHKIAEIQSVIGASFQLVTLEEAGIFADIPEPFHTLEANASGKSKAIYDLTHTDCFSEDTGLEVYALNGEPGVKSARYAGEERSAGKNTEKLLQQLSGKDNRDARFRTVISLLLNGRETLFEGICEGSIAQTPRGKNGFGYDPVFIPGGSEKTFAEMNMEEKSRFSHRRKATDQLVAFLQKQTENIS